MTASDGPDLHEWLSTVKAARRIGVSKRTVMRRADRWLSGDHDDPRALRAGRTSGTSGDRRIDPRDAERARLQLRGELAPTVTADEWLEDPRAHGQ